MEQWTMTVSFGYALALVLFAPLVAGLIKASKARLLIVQGAVGPAFPEQFLIGFGLLSISVAVPFILVQHDLKRLLAYSSIEHMGLITLGLGLGTPLAVYGALLHIINHAVTKSSLFYLAGAVIQHYGTKNMLRIKGLVSAMPVIGTMFVAAVLAIAGLPPFSVFSSKLTIVWAAFQAGNSFLWVIVLLLMAAIFAGIIYYTLKLGFGPIPNKAAGDYQLGKPALAAVAVSLVIMILGGIYLPDWLDTLITQAAAIIGGKV
ncbi:proton-conducting transporter membrane subunit [Sporomusa acidovorans]|uniref:NAD(P)H-quinone oxidoreductase subunit 2, chloroplastic n=1 Tax=Sporomusa acidovorans (strain ATCC 49682 / DSM 3132 / Mol) TaxID=1123286 RepID=A0ABZ3J1N6_SPOA4|nr:proton-conducting transporter membrane subunit [Sporomusa acidovorans]OZC14980.1 Na(+)/H(+) antiporter subunit D [Sporomusa acidovorans DSM 3132]SDE83374.1 Proton-conducting membrane transporter [Sporomusa acidovorans]